MNRRWVVLCLAALALSFAGCAPSLESKLVGRWRLDPASVDVEKALMQEIEQRTEGDDAAGTMAKAMMTMMQAMLQQVQLDVEMEFRADHTLTSRAAATVLGQTQERTQTGTWKVEAVGDKQLTVALTTQDAKTNSITITFLDDNTITAVGNMPGAGDQQAKFQRVILGG